MLRSMRLGVGPRLGGFACCRGAGILRDLRGLMTFWGSFVVLPTRGFVELFTERQVCRES